MKEYNLDLKMFIINNDGYVSMRNTQRYFCNGDHVAADAASGVYIHPIDAPAILPSALHPLRCSR